MPDRCGINCTDEELIQKNQEKIANYPDIDATVDFFKLFAHQSRLKILLILFDNELCVCDIAESIGLSIPATSQQLRMLRQAKVLSRRTQGKTAYYSFANEKMEKLIGELIFQTV